MKVRSGRWLFTGMVFVAAFAHGGTCTPDNLSKYSSNFSGGPGNGCTVSNLEYFNFFFQSTAVGQFIPDDVGNINVLPGGVDLTFSGFQSLAPHAGILTDFVGFDVDPAPVLTGDSISLDPPSGSVILDLYVCLPGTPFFVGRNPGDPADPNMYCGSSATFTGSATTSAIALDGPLVHLVNTGVNKTGSVTFATSTAQMGVLLRLTLDASDATAASLDAIENNVLQATAGPAPEPATWMLIGSGILITSLLRRFLPKRLS